MFITTNENTTEIMRLISDSEKVDCAVAFLGGKAPELLGQKGGRIICNLDSNGTNPTAVKKLLNETNFEVKNLSDLHAKIYIGDNYGIVSSANFSANGLGLEDDELNGWREAGYKVTDKNQIKRMRDWFEVLWVDASTIYQADIDQAQERWLEHRKNRLFSHGQKKKNMSFFEALKSDQSMFRDRGIFLTITTDRMSDKAQENLEMVKKREPQFSNGITAYENFQNIPENATLIDFYLNLKGGIKNAEFIEVCKSPVSGDPLLTINPPKELFLCYKKNDVFGFKISKEDKKELRNKVKELWSASIGKKDEGAKIIPIEEAFKILLS